MRFPAGRLRGAFSAVRVTRSTFSCSGGQLYLSQTCTGPAGTSCQVCVRWINARATRFSEGGTKSMATVPSYVEQQASLKEEGLIESLMDFSFQRMVTPRMLKMLYSLHLLLGLTIAIGFVFKGFQTSTSDGLLALILGVAGM